MQFKSKLPNIEQSIFSVMSNLARKEDAINLAQGFPDFDCDPKLQQEVFQSIQDGKNQYAPVSGVPELLHTLGKKISEEYNIDIERTDEITVTAGATQGIYTVISAVVNLGDEVIVIEPCYDSYVPSIRMNGGIPIYIRLTSDNGYKIPWDTISAKISKRTRMLIINSPHNPSGAILEKEDIDELEKLVEGTNILILSDEVYEHMVFDGKKHRSVLESELLRQRSFVTYSFGKVLHTTGWKLGYVVAPKELTREYRKLHQFLVFSCNTPMQYGIARYFEQKEYRKLSAFFEEKRDLFLRTLEGSRFSYTPTQGTYFQNVSFKEISDENDMDFAKRITKEYKVASIPTSAFYHDGYDDKIIRLCFAKSDEVLIESAEILKSI